MIYASCSELSAKLVCRCEPEVGDGYPITPVEAEHVLWLEVPVVDAQRMAILHRI